MFSTHYHELTSMSKKLPRIKNVHVSAEENNGNIVFLHKVKDGAIDKSYGINVASLAKLPKEVIERANEILAGHENNAKSKKDTNVMQTSFDFSENNSNKELLDEISKINPLELTPMEAINKLYEIVEKVKKEK